MQTIGDLGRTFIRSIQQYLSTFNACDFAVIIDGVVQKLLQFIFHIMQVDIRTHNRSQNKIACRHIIFSQTDRTTQNYYANGFSVGYGRLLGWL